MWLVPLPNLIQICNEQIEEFCEYWTAIILLEQNIIHRLQTIFFTIGLLQPVDYGVHSLRTWFRNLCLLKQVWNHIINYCIIKYKLYYCVNYFFLSEVYSSGQRDKCVREVYKEKRIFLFYGITYKKRCVENLQV